jgi:hypothetical protein
MMKYGVFEDGFPKGFYSDELHGDNIPPEAIEITDEQWFELINNQGMRRFIDGQVVEYTAPVEPVPPPPITRRQLRLTLVRNGIPLSSVEAAIAAMPDGLDNQQAQIECADASSCNRNHPTLKAIAVALGLSDTQIHAMWGEAAAA